MRTKHYTIRIREDLYNKIEETRGDKSKTEYLTELLLKGLNLKVTNTIEGNQ